MQIENDTSQNFASIYVVKYASFIFFKVSLSLYIYIYIKYIDNKQHVLLSSFLCTRLKLFYLFSLNKKKKRKILLAHSFYISVVEVDQ